MGGWGVGVGWGWGWGGAGVGWGGVRVGVGWGEGGGGVGVRVGWGGGREKIDSVIWGEGGCDWQRYNGTALYSVITILLYPYSETIIW